MIVMMLLISLSNCTTVPKHRIGFQIDPIKKKLCDISDRAKPVCYDIDAKDPDGQFMFMKYDGYVAISIRAIRETFHKTEKALSKARHK